MIDLPVLIDQCAEGIPPQVAAAIIQAESQGNPYAIHINVKDGEPRPLFAQPGTQREAVETAKRLSTAGYSIDVGLMQVNAANLQRFGVSFSEAFDPCVNIQAGAKVFADYARQVETLAHWTTPAGKLRAALSAYNTGSFTAGLKNGYVGRVMAALNGDASFALRPQEAPLEVAFRADEPPNEGEALSPESAPLIVEFSLPAFGSSDEAGESGPDSRPAGASRADNSQTQEGNSDAQSKKTR